MTRADLLLVIRCTDLTALADPTPREAIAVLCDRAVRPDPADPDGPAVAAVCVARSAVATAKERLSGTPVAVAAVAGDFPAGAAPLAARLAEVGDAVGLGANELDVVLGRDVRARGDHDAMTSEVAAFRAAAGGRLLKVILETADLAGTGAVYRAARAAMAGGADFVKTSTGARGGATPDAARALFEAARDFARDDGRRVGVKVSGGIRRAEDALAYLALCREVVGEAGATPAHFRIGASALLDDVVAHVRED